MRLEFRKQELMAIKVEEKQPTLARAISFDKALRPVVAHHPISEHDRDKCKLF